MILFIQHIDIEGPTALGRILKENNFDFRVVELYNEGSLPQNLSQIEAVIVLGGPMNVYEEEKYSYLKEEDFFIRRLIKEEIPFLGICLGSQLLAKAAGAKVIKSPEKEVGCFQISLTAEGKKDVLFSGLDDIIDVFQWHEDMWQAPETARLLAVAEKCPNQAFKVGKCAYGFQFHVEITEKDIVSWAKRYVPRNEVVEQQKKLIEDYGKHKKSLDLALAVVAKNFIEIIKNQEDK